MPAGGGAGPRGREVPAARAGAEPRPRAQGRPRPAPPRCRSRPRHSGRPRSPRRRRPRRCAARVSSRAHFPAGPQHGCPRGCGFRRSRALDFLTAPSFCALLFFLRPLQQTCLPRPFGSSPTRPSRGRTGEREEAYYAHEGPRIPLRPGWSIALSRPGQPTWGGGRGAESRKGIRVN